jgi:hypothetical protein
MTTRPIIRTRPGAGFITMLASLAILNILVLAAGCSSDRKRTSSATEQRSSDNGVVKLKQNAERMPPMGGAQLTQAQLAAVAGYVWSLSHT